MRSDMRFCPGLPLFRFFLLIALLVPSAFLIGTAAADPLTDLLAAKSEACFVFVQTNPFNCKRLKTQNRKPFTVFLVEVY